MAPLSSGLGLISSRCSGSCGAVCCEGGAGGDGGISGAGGALSGLARASCCSSSSRKGWSRPSCVGKAAPPDAASGEAAAVLRSDSNCAFCGGSDSGAAVSTNCVSVGAGGSTSVTVSSSGISSRISGGFTKRNQATEKMPVRCASKESSKATRTARRAALRSARRFLIAVPFPASCARDGTDIAARNRRAGRTARTTASPAQAASAFCVRANSAAS